MNNNGEPVDTDAFTDTEKEDLRQFREEMEVIKFFNDNTVNEETGDDLRTMDIWHPTNESIYTSFLLMFGQRMVGEQTWTRRFEELFHRYVQVPEEAFVVLLLENSTRVWYREHEIVMQNKKAKENRDEEANDEIMKPHTLLHQEKMKGKSTGGKWTQKGMLRLNALTDAIEKRRKESGWKEFAENLKAIMINQSVKVDAIGRKRRMEYGKKGRNGIVGNENGEKYNKEKKAKNYLNIIAL